MSSRIPSPARSQGTPITPRKVRMSRRTQSVSSSARSDASGRLSAVIQKKKAMESFTLSPMTRRSILTDNTQIEEPRRKSWWKNLKENSQDIIEILENNVPEANVVVNEYMDVEVLSQEKKNLTLDLPDSSDGESITSIVLPQRKLFTQKDIQEPQKKFGEIIGSRETLAKLQKTNVDKTINIGTKNLFSHDNKNRKPVFPAELLTLSPNKTVANKTKEMVAAEVQSQVKNLFGNRLATKRKNMFADFIVSDTEDEISDIQPKVFAFQKRVADQSKRISSISRGNKEHSPTSSITTDIEMDDWKLLPSSTMVEHQHIEAGAITPKRSRLSKLLETKESDTAYSNSTVNRTKQSKAIHQALTSKNEDNQLLQHDSTDKTKNITAKEDKIMINKSHSIDPKVHENHKATNDQIGDNVDPIESGNNKKHEIESLHDNSTASKSQTKNVDNFQKNCAQGKLEAINNAQEAVSICQRNYNISKNELEMSEPALKKLESENDFREKEDDKVDCEQESIDDDIQNAAFEQVDDVQKESENVRKEIEGDQASKIGNLVSEKDKQEDCENTDAYSKEECDKTQEKKGAEEQDDEIHEKLVFDEDNEEEQENISDQNVSEQMDINDDNNHENSEDQQEVVEENDEEQDEIEDENDQIDQDEMSGYEDGQDKESEQEEIDTEQEKNDQDEEDQSKQIEQADEIELVDQFVETEDEEQDHDEDEQNENIVEEDEIELIDQLEKTENEDQEQDKEEEEVEQMEEEVEQMEEDVEDIENDQQYQDEVEHSDQIDEEDDIEPIDQVEESENEEECQEEESENEEVQVEENQIEDEEAEIDLSDQLEEHIDEPGSEDEIEYSGENNSAAPNKSHDTTGRNRKANKPQINSPELLLQNKTFHADSFTAQERVTSVRKTKSMIKPNLKPNLATLRESISFSDGTRNSSAEASEWDSHRTTRKTLRQTFGKDFTPRKSLRALVMEKSAKRQTAVNDASIKFPQANSTEVHCEMQDGTEMDVDCHDPDASRQMRQTTFEMYLQKVKEENMAKKLKLEEDIRKSLKAPPRLLKENINPVKSKFGLRKINPKIQSKPKTKLLKSIIPMDALPEEILEDMKYKPPKRFRPRNAAWITNRLYRYLESKLEPKYDYRARVRAEKLVEMLYNLTKEARRFEVASNSSVDLLKQEMARLDIVKTHFEFYEFFHEFMPREIRIKVVPDVVNKLSLPRHGVFSQIIS